MTAQDIQTVNQLYFTATQASHVVVRYPAVKMADKAGILVAAFNSSDGANLSLRAYDSSDVDEDVAYTALSCAIDKEVVGRIQVMTDPHHSSNCRCGLFCSGVLTFSTRDASVAEVAARKLVIENVGSALVGITVEAEKFLSFEFAAAGIGGWFGIMQNDEWAIRIGEDSIEIYNRIECFGSGYFPGGVATGVATKAVFGADEWFSKTGGYVVGAAVCAMKSDGYYLMVSTPDYELDSEDGGVEWPTKPFIGFRLHKDPEG